MQKSSTTEMLSATEMPSNAAPAATAQSTKARILSKQKPSIATLPQTQAGNATFIEGGLGAVKGVRCAGISAGFRRNPQRRDLALVVTDTAAVASGVFTQNTFCAAPVKVSQKHLALASLTEQESLAGAAGVADAKGVAGAQGVADAKGAVDAKEVAGAAGVAGAVDAAGSAHNKGVYAIILNSGNANAATGEPGMQTSIHTAQIVAEQLQCQPHQVLVASTGVIGMPLSEKLFDTGVPQAVLALGSSGGTDLESGLHAAQAIMTTDTHPKQAAAQFSVTQKDGSQTTYTIGGMVKGSGMIQPNMATLLGVFATDAWLTQEAADKALKLAMDHSLNRVTVDSDTSTNDSVFFLATGATKGDTITANSLAFESFVSAFTALSKDLARQIAYDGEGATKLVTVNICGALDNADADKAGRAVANSPLVKTAIAGHDANWGRIAMAIGKSGATFKQEDVAISVMGLPVCKHGLPVPFDEEEALHLFEQNLEIVIDIDLGVGAGKASLWTCDFTHDYISINGDYRS